MPVYCRRTSPGGIGGRGGADEAREKPCAQRDREYNFFAATLFSHEQLKILDYNRVVKDLRGMTVQEFLARVGERFIVKPGFKERAPFRPHQFGMYLKGAWYLLEAKPELYGKADLIGKLDVSILQDHLLGPVLGIADPRTDDRIKFVGGIRGMNELERMVDQMGYTLAFSLYPRHYRSC